MTLYELSAEYAELLSMAESEDLDVQTLKDTLEGIEGEIEDKADGYAKVITQLAGDAEIIKAEVTRLTAKKAVLENNVKRLKEALQFTMQAIGKPKFKTSLYSFGIQKNPPSLKIDIPDEAVPVEYHIPQPDKIDTSAIKNMLKKGTSCEWAHLEQTESLRIR